MRVSATETAPPAEPSSAAPPAPPDPDPAVVARLRRIYVAIGLSALLLFASFHPIDLGPLVLVGLVPWFYVAATETTRVAAVMSHTTTWLYHLVGLSWIAVVTPEGWLITSFLEGFYGIALCCGSLWLRRRTGLPLAVVLPPLGAALELIRGNFPFIAFPWLFFGQALHGRDLLVQIVDLTSVYGLTALVLLMNGAIVDLLLLLRERWSRDQELGPADLRRLSTIALGVLCAFGLAGIYGWVRTRQVRAALEDGPRLLVVQVDFPQSVKDSAASAAEVANANLRLTRDALRKMQGSQTGARVDAIVWSETMWPWPLPDLRTLEQREAYAEFVAWYRERAPAMAAKMNEKLAELRNLVRDTRAALLVGAMDTYWADYTGIGGFREHNSFYCVQPTGDPATPVAVTDRYDKINLVPASEYIPGEGSTLFGWFYALIKSFIPPGFTVFEPGAGPVVMEVGKRPDGTPWRLAPNICFEISFPELLRRSTALGADVHVCPANDGWFVRGKGSEVQPTAEIPLARAHTRLRAIENRRAVVRCVNRGVSLVMDPLGEVQAVVGKAVPPDGAWREVGIEDTLVATVKTTSLMPLYVRVGNLFAWACLLVSAGLGVAAWRGKRLLDELPPPPEAEPDPRGPDHGEPEPGDGAVV